MGRTGTRTITIVVMVPVVVAVIAGIAADAPVPGMIPVPSGIRAVIVVVRIVSVPADIVPGIVPVPVAVTVAPGAPPGVVPGIAPVAAPRVVVIRTVELAEAGLIGLSIHQFRDYVKISLLVFGEVLIVLTLTFFLTLRLLRCDHLGARICSRAIINSVVVHRRGIVPRRATRAGECRESKDHQESESIVFHFYLLCQFINNVIFRIFAFHGFDPFLGRPFNR